MPILVITQTLACANGLVQELPLGLGSAFYQIEVHTTA